MKKIIIPISVFLVTFIVYFAVGTQFTFKPKWALDYFNPLANSLLSFRLDIQNPGTTYDLSYYNGKWYGPWGIIPALILIPFQLLKGRFIPIFYLSIFFSSLNTLMMYYLLCRIKKDFLPGLSKISLFIFLLFFTFGTTQFYVGTLGSMWHVDQITTSFLGTLGIYAVFRKERRFIHYFTSVLCFSLALLGRPTLVLLNILPVTLYLHDFLTKRKLSERRRRIFFKETLLLSMPLLFFSFSFFLYNYFRFNNVFEYGFSYIREAPYLEQIRIQNGAFSIKNIPQNLWYMLLELPKINFSDKISLDFNLKGNSILFLSPPLIASFLAFPFIKKGKKFIFNPIIASLWLTAIITIIPSLMHYGSGWMQFGYRFALDINVLLVLLSVFGMKGKVNVLYAFGVFFSVLFYSIGINALM